MTTKRFKGKKASKQTQNEENLESSTVISAIIADKNHTVLCDDGGSDINLLSGNILQVLQEKDCKICIQKWKKPSHFGLAASHNVHGQEFTLECDREGKLNISLLLRYGYSLELSTTIWYVPTSRVNKLLMGRPTLEALGINKMELLFTTIDKKCNTIDMDSINEQKPKNGTIAQMIKHVIYQIDKPYIAKNENDHEVWMDLDVEKPGEISPTIENPVVDGKDKFMNSQVSKQLEERLNKYRNVLIIKL